MRAFFADQKNKVNNYVETVKESGRKVVDMTYTFLPPGERKDSVQENPDICLSAPSIIARHGYRCETHTIVSQGYMLNVHRIPTGKYSKTIPSKIVYIQHGLLGSSADWVINGPTKGLAYVLADAGYDVWLGNVRGNKYSREHGWMKPHSKAYWNFSWHDVAVYDIPAIIDFILKLKGPDAKIAYIGHSMGTTILFAMLAERPEYNNILTVGIALAPVVFLKDMKSPIKTLAPAMNNMATMEMALGSHEFVPKLSTLGKILSKCHVDSLDNIGCKRIIFYICGSNEQQFNKLLMPVFLKHLGSGTSWKSAIHFAQQIISGQFQKFDYGSVHNKRLYGTETPPSYDLSKVTLLLSLFWAKNDLLSSEKDVKTLKDMLPPTTECYLVPCPEFNHVDYLWAVDAHIFLNGKILLSLEKAFNR